MKANIPALLNSTILGSKTSHRYGKVLLSDTVCGKHVFAVRELFGVLHLMLVDWIMFNKVGLLPVSVNQGMLSCSIIVCVSL